MTNNPQKIYSCVVYVENRGMTAGYSEARFRATAWKFADDCLVFSIPGDAIKAFNWAKVFYFDVELEVNQ